MNCMSNASSKNLRATLTSDTERAMWRSLAIGGLLLKADHEWSACGGSPVKSMAKMLIHHRGTETQRKLAPCASVSLWSSSSAPCKDGPNAQKKRGNMMRPAVLAAAALVLAA